MVEPTAVLLIFVSGKVVLTSVKTNERILEAVNEIFPKLTIGQTVQYRMILFISEDIRLHNYTKLNDEILTRLVSYSS